MCVNTDESWSQITSVLFVLSKGAVPSRTLDHTRTLWCSSLDLHFVGTHLCYDGGRAVLDLVLNPIMHLSREFYSHESHKAAAGCHQRNVSKRFQGCKCCNFSHHSDMTVYVYIFASSSNVSAVSWFL